MGQEETTQQINQLKARQQQKKQNKNNEAQKTKHIHKMLEF